MLAKIGDVPWSRDEMVAKLKEFSEVYAKRPIAENVGGMRSPHLFALWFTLGYLKPKTVIECGVLRGQGTWFIEQACPNAELFCVDINWSRIKYRSERAKYLTGDIEKHDWSGIDKEQTLVFLDDHVNSPKRCHSLQNLGFRHLIFEDNYFPPEVSDFYTLKCAFAHRGYKAPKNLRYYAGLIRGTRSDRTVPPNSKDDENLRKILEVYREYPPIYTIPTTRWGIPWDATMPTERPLLTEVSEDYQQVFLDEAKWYTWICYVRLKTHATR